MSEARRIIRCYITGRDSLPGASECNAEQLIDLLLANIARHLEAGVEWVQIREKDLPARTLYELVQRVLALPNRNEAKVLVNSRLDVALAAGAQGVHLPAGSPEARRFRSLTKPGFLIGASCHSVEEVQAAEAGGADYVVFGPVFAPISKESNLAPRGLSGLTEAVSAVKITVLALGGIGEAQIAACEAAGAAGIAGISLYQSLDSSTSVPLSGVLRPRS